jgi:hypothetical protein
MVRDDDDGSCRKLTQQQQQEPPPGDPAEGERPLARATTFRSKLYRLWNNAVNTQVPFSLFIINYQVVNPASVLPAALCPD